MLHTILRLRLLLLAVLLSPTLSYSQVITATDRHKGYEQRQKLAENAFFQALEPENIGPSIFSCRVSDVEVNPADPTEMYVAYASGGLWHTRNNGTTFQPIFDKEAAMTIGDIAVDWKTRAIWIGTGESNSSRSSYAGDGMYFSGDGGKTWQRRGLPESHHIGRVVLHPTDPNTLWVAALGHLYSPNPERGVYKTVNGGKTWEQTLFVNDTTGAVDLCIDPADPNIVYAATWERTRRAWHFEGAGAGSAIWKSTDGGQRWTRLSGGFPTGPKTGRIGLGIGRGKDGRTVLYASVDNQNPSPKKEKPAADGLTKDQLRNMTTADFVKLTDEKLGGYLKEYFFPEKYSAKKIREMVEKGKITPQTLVEYVEDANANLFETDFTGAEVYRSNDGGKNWQKPHRDPLEAINFTYGYYFSNVRCAPNDPEKVYLLGYHIVRSDDGGKNWVKITQDNVHADHHALWVNPARPGHLVNGNDGGLNQSWDDGQSWVKCNNPPVGQFYAIATDQAEPYNVYGGAQDNGVWVGPSNYKASTDWHQSGQYPYRELMGGDGMQVAIDTRNNNTVYTGFQFGNYFRLPRDGNSPPRRITPRHEIGERPLRFNWQTPIHLSRHNQDVLYFGTNRLYRSFDRGDNWEPISGDLTGGGRKGNVPFGTLTAIHESPLRFGLLYVGTDDGRLHVSRDGGETWTRIDGGLPQGLWISRVQASAHNKSRVYASLNGYRHDDFASYLYVSDNYGQTWTQLGADLPAEPVNVVKEDHVNTAVLYVGTDHGVYLSIDQGQHFAPLGRNFPATPVHDLVVQPKTNDLVIGTHGRSMYKINVAAIQALTTEALAEAVRVFDIPKQRFSKNWGKKQPWETLKNPSVPVLWYSRAAGKATWTLKTEDGLTLQTGQLASTAGMNGFDLPLTTADSAMEAYQKKLSEAQKKPVTLTKADSGAYILQKGTYTLEIVSESGGKSAQKLVVE